MLFSWIRWWAREVDRIHALFVIDVGVLCLQLDVLEKHFAENREPKSDKWREIAREIGLDEPGRIKVRS